MTSTVERTGFLEGVREGWEEAEEGREGGGTVTVTQTRRRGLHLSTRHHNLYSIRRVALHTDLSQTSDLGTA